MVQQRRKSVQVGGGEKDDDVQSELSDFASQKSGKSRKKGGTIKSILRQAAKSKKRIAIDGKNAPIGTIEEGSRTLTRRSSKVRWELSDIEEAAQDAPSENSSTKPDNLVVCVQDDNAASSRTSNVQEDGTAFIERVSEYLDNLLNSGDDQQPPPLDSSNTTSNGVKSSDLQPVPLKPTTSALNRDSMKLADELVLKMLGNAPTDETSKETQNVQQVMNDPERSKSTPVLNLNMSATQELGVATDKYRSIDHDDEDYSVQSQRSVILKAAQQVSRYTNELLSILSHAPSHGEHREHDTEKSFTPLNTISEDKYRPAEGEPSTPSPKKTLERPSSLLLVDEEIDTISGNSYADDLSPLSTKSARSSMLAKKRFKRLGSFRKKNKHDSKDDRKSLQSMDDVSDGRSLGLDEEEEFESHIEICNDELIHDGTDKYSQNSTFEYEKKTHLPAEQNLLRSTPQLSVQRQEGVTNNNATTPNQLGSNEAPSTQPKETTEAKASTVQPAQRNNDDSPFITKNQFLELMSMLRGEISNPVKTPQESQSATTNQDEQARGNRDKKDGSGNENEANKSASESNSNKEGQVEEQRHQNESSRERTDNIRVEAEEERGEERHKHNSVRAKKGDRRTKKEYQNKSARKTRSSHYIERPRTMARPAGPIDLTISSSGTTDSGSVMSLSVGEQQQRNGSTRLQAIPSGLSLSSSGESSDCALESVQLVSTRQSHLSRTDQSRRFILDRKPSRRSTKGGGYYGFGSGGGGGHLRLSKGKTPRGEIQAHAGLSQAMSAISLDDDSSYY